MKFIEPKEIIIDNVKYIISKFPAIAGREIIAGYPLSAIPKLSEYHQNEAIMLKLMKYVAKPIEGRDLMALDSRELIDNHVKSWESLMAIERAMIEYNCSFFRDGRISKLLSDFAQNIPQFLSKILMDVLLQFSQISKPLSNNSEQSTH
jgi:hypothetical protein